MVWGRRKGEMGLCGGGYKGVGWLVMVVLWG